MTQDTTDCHYIQEITALISDNMVDYLHFGGDESPSNDPEKLNINLNKYLNNPSERFLDAVSTSQKIDHVDVNRIIYADDGDGNNEHNYQIIEERYYSLFRSILRIPNLDMFSFSYDYWEMPPTPVIRFNENNEIIQNEEAQEQEEEDEQDYNRDNRTEQQRRYDHAVNVGFWGALRSSSNEDIADNNIRLQIHGVHDWNEFEKELSTSTLFGGCSRRKVITTLGFYYVNIEICQALSAVMDKSTGTRTTINALSLVNSEIGEILPEYDDDDNESENDNNYYQSQLSRGHDGIDCLQSFFRSIVNNRTSIINLDLTHSELGPMGCYILCNAIAGSEGFSKLEVLNLSENEIGNDGCNEIASSLYNNKNIALKSLNLRYNDIDDVGFKSLCEKLLLCDHPTLEELDLMENEISENGWKDLVSLLENRNQVLESIGDLNWIRDCPSETKTLIEFYLKLNCAGRQYIVDDGKEQWMSCLKKVNDDIQCLNYFISNYAVYCSVNYDSSGVKRRRIYE